MANVRSALPSMVSDDHNLAAKGLQRYRSYLASPILSHLWTVVCDVGPLCLSWRQIVSLIGSAPEVFAEVVM